MRSKLKQLSDFQIHNIVGGTKYWDLPHLFGAGKSQQGVASSGKGVSGMLKITVAGVETKYVYKNGAIHKII